MTSFENAWYAEINDMALRYYMIKQTLRHLEDRGEEYEAVCEALGAELCDLEMELKEYQGEEVEDAE